MDLGGTNEPAVKQAGPHTSARARRVLTDAGEGDLQAIVDLVQTLCGVEIAALGVLDEQAFHYLVTAGVDVLSAPQDSSLCQWSMGTPGVFMIEDASQDERTRASPFVDGTSMALRFYASAPFYAPDGGMAGRLCVFDTSVKRLTPVQEQALATLSDSVTKILHLRLDQLTWPTPFRSPVTWRWLPGSATTSGCR